ncbi:MAG TPA: TauD/TfdA family dioxygenase [Bordetella sp.]|jgi:alpha-ketoglutarate-dependent 2,4-dichlorophenoxyacetate dioxygenase|nr:TauD/TfdA family dioxygenase [Bordetella sp.]
MTLAIKPLHPLYAAEIQGVQTGAAIDDAVFAEIRAAFETYSIIVLRDQQLDDDSQIAFSRRFGELQVTPKVNPGVGSYFARQSNLDIATNQVIPPDDRRMLHQKANFLWHTDSSYRPIPSLCSILSGRVVPPEGGNTEFCTTRAAYDELPEALKRKISGLYAEHSLVHSRSLVDPRALTEEMRNELPPSQQPLTRINPVNGKRSVFVGSHASHIVGWPLEEGRALLKELNDFVTQPRFVYSHAWRAGDLIVWDNRCILHRATPYDTQKYQRVMLRTTVEGDAAEYAEEKRRLAA